MLDLFGMYLLLRYIRPLVSLRILERGAKIRDLQH